jgi:hypothetical protein
MPFGHELRVSRTRPSKRFVSRIGERRDLLIVAAASHCYLFWWGGFYCGKCSCDV